MPSLSGDISNKSWVFIWNKSVVPFFNKVETGSSVLLGKIAAADGTGRQGGANPCYLFWIKIAYGVSGASNLPRENRESSAPNFLPQSWENLRDSDMSGGAQKLKFCVSCLNSPASIGARASHCPLIHFRRAFGAASLLGDEDLAYSKGLKNVLQLDRTKAFMSLTRITKSHQWI